MKCLKMGVLALHTRYIRGSAAYDLERFQPRQRMRVKKPTLVVAKQSNQAIRARAKAVSVLKIMATVAVVAMVVITMLYSRAVLTELSQKINAATAQLDIVKSEGTRLSSELESKVSLRNVEEYATQVLGMSAMDKKQVTYMDLSDGDKVELTSESPKQSLFDRIQLAISNVEEYIANA